MSIVLIHPLLTDKFWVQSLPMPPSASGKWQCNCYFGSETQGAGESFELNAIASKEALKLKEGDVLSKEEARGLLEKYPTCEPLTLKRTK